MSLGHFAYRRLARADEGVLRRYSAQAAAKASFREAAIPRPALNAYGWRRVLVVSDPHHRRRLSWAWGRVFRDGGLSYSLVAGSPQWWDADGWWRGERRALAVIGEYIKLAYYLVKY